VVQTDAAGFLVGWAITAGSQIAVDGSFTASPIGGQMSTKEKQRITGGVVGAITASSGGITKVASGLVKWINGLW